MKISHARNILITYTTVPNGVGSSIYKSKRKMVDSQPIDLRRKKKATSSSFTLSLNKVCHDSQFALTRVNKTF